LTGERCLSSKREQLKKFCCLVPEKWLKLWPVSGFDCLIRDEFARPLFADLQLKTRAAWSIYSVSNPPREYPQKAPAHFSFPHSTRVILLVGSCTRSQSGVITHFRRSPRVGSNGLEASNHRLSAMVTCVLGRRVRPIALALLWSRILKQGAESRSRTRPAGSCL
jgi:hypothetical protein